MTFSRFLMLAGLMALTSACGKEKELAPTATIFLPVPSAGSTEPGDLTRPAPDTHATTAKEIKKAVTALEVEPGPTVLVQTLSGEAVEVSTATLKAALTVALRTEGKIFKSLSINNDGSVSIDEPGFLFDRQTRWLAVDESQHFEQTYVINEQKYSMTPHRGSSLGVCRLLGFEDTLAVNLSREAHFAGQGVELRPDGSLYNVNRTLTEGAPTRAVQSITCAKIRAL